MIVEQLPEINSHNVCQVEILCDINLKKKKNGRIFVENSIVAEWHIYISKNVQTLNSTPSRKVPFSTETFSLLLLKSSKVGTN